MAYLGSRLGAPPEICERPGFQTKAEIFEHLCASAPEFDSVELTPHEPPVAGVYYPCDVPPAGDGRRLAELLDRFTPATPTDRGLLQALLMTLVWGGPPGSRPAFVITADSGPGSGKTTAVKIAASLVGGAVELRSSEDGAALLKRLLSADARSKRIVSLDNLKSDRFSSSDLEGLITSSVLSGHELYKGEGRRPNLVTTVITVNGASLSVDLAQRVVVITLGRPTYSATWEEETLGYVERHRDEIIADLIAALRREPALLPKYTRFGTWDRGVLAKIPDAEAAQRLILDRQAAVNVEDEEADTIVAFFAERLSDLDFRPDDDKVFLPNAYVTAWYNAAMNENCKTTKVTKTLDRIAERSKGFPIKRSRSHGGGRGFEWNGRNARSDALVRRDLAARRGGREWPMGASDPSRGDTSRTEPRHFDF